MPARAIVVFDPDAVDLDAPWRREALCREQFLEDPLSALKWDTRDKNSVAFKAATEVCKECPVRDMCVPDAVADETASGNRGGFGFDKGTVLATDAAKIKREFGLEARTRYQTSKANLAEAG